MVEISKGDLVQSIPLLAIFGYMFFVQRVIEPNFPEAAPYAAAFGVLLIIVMVPLMEALALIATASYLFLALTVRGPEGSYTLDLWVNREKFRTEQVRPGYYVSTLPLAKNANHPELKKIKKIKIEHEETWNERFDFSRGLARLWEEEFKHANVAACTVYEKPRVTPSEDHLEPVPTFVLVEAPKDYYQVSSFLTKLKRLKDSSTDQKKDFDTEQLKTEYKALQDEYGNLKSQYNEAKQKLYAQEELVQQLRNAFQALLTSTADFKDMLIQYLLAWRHKQLTIENALSSLRGRNWTVPREVVAGVVALAAIGYFYYYPDSRAEVMSWLSIPSNALTVLALVGLMVAGVYYATKRRR